MQMVKVLLGSLLVGYLAFFLISPGPAIGHFFLNLGTYLKMAVLFFIFDIVLEFIGPVFEYKLKNKIKEIVEYFTISVSDE